MHRSTARHGTGVVRPEGRRPSAAAEVLCRSLGVGGAMAHSDAPLRVFRFMRVTRAVIA